MGLKRFLKEFKDPSLKCERVGHNFREYVRRGYYDGGFMSVVTQVVQLFVQGVPIRKGGEELHAFT